MANKDFDVMRHFVKRQSWKMSFSDDGYFYGITEKGNSPEISDNSNVMCNYTITLLDGTLCYDRKDVVFVVGSTDEITGLHHAIKRLGNKGKAKFIFPAHLAFGLPGDLNKIPPRAILIYDVTVTNTEKR